MGMAGARADRVPRGSPHTTFDRDPWISLSRGAATQLDGLWRAGVPPACGLRWRARRHSRVHAKSLAPSADSPAE